MEHGLFDRHTALAHRLLQGPIAERGVRSRVDHHVDPDAVNLGIGHDQLARSFARGDHDLEPGIAAQRAGIVDCHEALAEIEQDALVLQAVDAKDALGADMRAFEDRRDQPVIGAAAEHDLLDLDRIDLLRAGNTDQRGAGIGHQRQLRHQR